jgi:hypothetical protein
MDYISVRQASEKWGVSERWVQKLCEDSRIDGAMRFDNAWAIPKDTARPPKLKTGKRPNSEGK